MSVLIAGAGPAGASLAYLLAIQGIKVVLVERLVQPYMQAFSSAALPIGTVYENWIPSESISSFWNTWRIHSPEDNCFEWIHEKDLGVVLDFGEYRKLMWQRAQQFGVHVLLGWKVKKVVSLKRHADVEIISRDGITKSLKANLVIDATGQKRSILGTSYDRSDELLIGNGIEWILQSKSQDLEGFNKNLTFFLGTKWVKNGYGWIFPMSLNRIKVGICRLPPYNNIASNIRALNSLIKKNNLEDLAVLERHGGIIRSTIKRSDKHIDGRIVGIGDTISTSNLLGGEGIRHALRSSEILARNLAKVLNGNKYNDINDFLVLRKYKNDLKKELGWQWPLTNKIAKKTWWSLSSDKEDQRIEKILKHLHANASAKDLSGILFDYKFQKYGARMLPYITGIK